MPSSIAIQAGPGAGFVILLFLAFLIVVTGLIVWTYQDAQKHSSQSAALWALVVFLAPFLGLILYFLVGRDLA